MTDDEHKPEGRTAHECFELARIALDQAEIVVNRATSTVECAKAQASAAIGIGWARLGDALANEPRELEPIVDPVEMAAWVRRRFADHGPLWCGKDEGKCWVCSLRQSFPVTPPRLDETPDHVHSPDCAHQWISPTEPCRACAQGTIRNQERCPVPCPEPGEWWVHLPGRTRERG